jgi:GT2 family glycosyltransferase
MAFAVRVIEEPRRGASVARNAGIRSAKGELIAFTDSDCAPAPAWLRSLAEPFSDPDVGGVAGRVTAAAVSSAVETLSALYTLRPPNGAGRWSSWTPREGGFPTANLAVRRALLEQLGGFDEQVGLYGEDYDLCARLYGLGKTIVYASDAQVSHSHRTTVRGMLRQAFGFGRSHAYLFRRHGIRGLWLAVPFLTFTWPGCPIPAWLELASADKKVMGILAAGVVFPPLHWLLGAYAMWLVVQVGKRAERSGMALRLKTRIGVAGLLLFKSFALTAGRWWGSVKYGALCF